MVFSGATFPLNVQGAVILKRVFYCLSGLRFIEPPLRLHLPTPNITLLIKLGGLGLQLRYSYVPLCTPPIPVICFNAFKKIYRRAHMQSAAWQEGGAPLCPRGKADTHTHAHTCVHARTHTDGVPEGGGDQPLCW